ncbi:cytochrome P450 [Mycena rosella]|uniref:Cytochrome P450 n=1 Tax=Mycena rosella TaxID=1033263 RepID=A0AAD7G133_MYCRO|nr:cytochrome P450 [Mycena rosella]
MSSLTEYSWPAAILLALSLLCLSTLFTFYRSNNTQKPHSGLNIPELGGFSLLAAWPFFAKRDDFLWSNFKKTGAEMFRFRALQHHVVAMHGTEARKAFFTEKGLNLPEGYALLFGTSPTVRDLQDVDTAEYTAQFLLKQFTDLLSKERLANGKFCAVFPSLLKDTDRLMAGWSSEGTMDPFKELNDIVFQLTVRLGSCRELAEDLDAVARMSQLLDNLEKAATPAALLLPWLPTAARKAKQKNTRELFALIYSFVETRRAASVRSSDTIDFLLGNGFSTENVVEFILGLIHAGYINTGMNVGWNLLYIGMHPEWKAKVSAEFRALLATHTDAASTDPIHERLASIPLGAWETELPVVDAGMRETLRMTMGLLALRRNLGGDITMAGRTILAGDFLAYPLGDVHHNPDIYPEPYKWDPHRYDAGREEDKQAPLAFLGWGGGRHMCAGMRIAKLEIKLILALFVLSFEFQVVDGAGALPKSLPRVDFNDFQRPRPVQGNPCYIKFRRLKVD